jgi:hypothetical protein
VLKPSIIHIANHRDCCADIPDVPDVPYRGDEHHGTKAVNILVLAETIVKRIATRVAPPDAPLAPIVERHIASTLFTLLTWWMDHHHPVAAVCN